MVKKKLKFKKTKKFIYSIISVPKILMDFLKSVGRELSEVEWLTKRETMIWSIAVITTAILVSILIIFADIIFFKLRSVIFKF